MKLKTTKKAMREGYYYILGVGYCRLQFLLQYESPFAYSTRAEGWACDYYDVGGVLISTGYAPLDSRNTRSSYHVEKKYDDLARDILAGPGSYEERKAAVDALLQEFIASVKGE